MHRLAVEAELARAAPASGSAPKRNSLVSTALGITVMRLGRNAARDDFAAQALADRRDVIGTAQRERFERARRAVAQAALASSCRGRPPRPPTARAPRRRPECRALASDPERRQRIQHGRMRVQDVRPERPRPARRCAARWPPSPAGRSTPGHASTARCGRIGVRWKRQPSTSSTSAVACAVPRRGELQRFPAERALLAQDRERSGTSSRCADGSE